MKNYELPNDPEKTREKREKEAMKVTGVFFLLVAFMACMMFGEDATLYGVVRSKQCNDSTGCKCTVEVPNSRHKQFVFKYECLCDTLQINDTIPLK